MTLYHYGPSSASWRVRLALALKGLDCDWVHVDLRAKAQHTPAFLAINPLGQVPVLAWEEQGQARRLTQSLAIVQYLEHRFPEVPLLPADPYDRARAWQLAELVNAGIQPLQNLYVRSQVKAFGGDVEAWLHHHIGRGLDALEHEAAGAGHFLVGQQPTVAECCLIPQLWSARSVGLDTARWPTLSRIDAHCATLPAFQAAHVDVWMGP